MREADAFEKRLFNFHAGVIKKFIMVPAML